MLQSQTSEVFSAIEVPPFKPSLRDSLNNCQTSRGLTVCVLTKKKDFIATIECGKIRQKPRYTVNEVPLTKNSLRAPFVACNNSFWYNGFILRAGVVTSDPPPGFTSDCTPLF